VPFNVRLCAEFFINHRPDLVDILFEPSVHGGSSLLPPLSAVAKQCAAMSRVMLQEGLFEVARIFADFAGDDLLTYLAMICECSKIEDNTYGKPGLVWIHDKIVHRRNDFLRFKESLVAEDGSVTQAKLFHSLKVLENVTEKILLQKGNTHTDDLVSVTNTLNLSISELFSFSSTLSSSCNQSALDAPIRKYLTVQSICGAELRRSSLQVLVGGPLDPQVAWLAKSHGTKLSKSTVDMMTTKPAIINNNNNNNNNIVSSYYLMDAVEEWLCLRTYPEVHSPNDLFSKVGKTQATIKDIIEDESRPLSWVEGVGAGKDWEKLVAYWRFSDPITSKDELFISTGLPGSRLCLPDLSKVRNFINQTS
jgi:hypothetical protein